MTTVWTPEQQAEHRKIWVEALRSNQFSQAKRTLRDAGGGMCCLGVACAISGLGSFQEDHYFRDVAAADMTPDEYGDYPASVVTDEYATESVRKWLGLATEQGCFTDEDGDKTSLAKANDSGASFSEIADIIEAAPPGLIASPIPA